jgi:hypothetical protein
MTDIMKKMVYFAKRTGGTKCHVVLLAAGETQTNRKKAQGTGITEAPDRAPDVRMRYRNIPGEKVTTKATFLAGMTVIA